MKSDLRFVKRMIAPGAVIDLGDDGAAGIDRPEIVKLISRRKARSPYRA